jgi:hypothetical protein
MLPSFPQTATLTELATKLVRVGSSVRWINQGQQVKHGHEDFLAQPGQSEVMEFESLDQGW